MPKTVPNQRTIIVHKIRPEYNFLQISNEHWMKFNKKYGPFALQLYLYFAKNADGFTIALSQEAAELEAGITKTTFHKYVNLLIKEGYLVKRKGNTYDFYEIPRKQEQEGVGSSPCGEWSSSQGEQQNLPHNHRSSLEGTKSPQANKEIDKRYINNTQIEKDIPQQQEESGKNTERTKKEFVF